MKVHDDEGLASRIGPELCAGIREGVGEASAGERIGQPLSHEIVLTSGCRRISICGRRYRATRHCERLTNLAWSQNLACAYAPCAGTGRSAARPSMHSHRRVRIGKARSCSR